jgi:hypothetical protein
MGKSCFAQLSMTELADFIAAYKIMCFEKFIVRRERKCLAWPGGTIIALSC